MFTENCILVKTRLSSLFKFKGSIPSYLVSHLICKFSYCCCNATYYGETERHLSVRVSEHLGITPFGNLKIGNTKDTLHYRYYDGIGVFFDASVGYGGTGLNELRNLIIYGVNMKNFTFATNKKHHIYILGKSFTQGLQYGATIYAEHDYVKVNGSQLNKKFILSVHYNGDNSYLFINGIKQFQFKAMSSLNLNNPLIIGNTSSNFLSHNDYEKASLHGEIYDFFVSYQSSDIKKIYDIHRHLMKKHDI